MKRPVQAVTVKRFTLEPGSLQKSPLSRSESGTMAYLRRMSTSESQKQLFASRKFDYKHAASGTPASRQQKDIVKRKILRNRDLLGVFRRLNIKIFRKSRNSEWRVPFDEATVNLHLLYLNVPP